MKDNRKNRKLKYIRYKNKLRFGKSYFGGYIKYSCLLDEDTIKIMVEDLIKRTHNELLKKFKIKLNTVNLRSGYDGWDFVQNNKTVICELRNVFTKQHNS